ncbi:activator of Hsp90 ATPase, N-terminal-domain containing protein [Nitzschia inconspicua]|uniref:Activator of Hsp90 ATPase, N-terminal-domain containing protein n=1 Tax=Nitzschia inconspicua TaxID=303405 RepID=A0A9K3LN31_9STRA|nr:activator of Hsp90 ATPase, N-terminal-domain containing protein [Nitzschia inconspicua]KAG7363466.1 activator of Hsp90 ATPase, N-terminal-domain containing protein [Nitzschia inconspicua]
MSSEVDATMSMEVEQLVVDDKMKEDDPATPVSAQDDDGQGDVEMKSVGEDIVDRNETAPEDVNDTVDTSSTVSDDSSDPVLEDDDDDDEEEENSTDKPKEDPEILLIKASACKEEGNKFFTEEKDFEKASRAYRKGVNAIKNLNKANTGDEQVKTLLLTLQTNLSMMQFKLEKYSQSQAVASKALEIDPHHVKALYRRAAARRKLGDPDGALADLKLALSKEPNNAACRKDFALLKKEIDAAKKKQKTSMQKAFSKGGLYDDKEEEKKKQDELAKQKKKEEEEALKKRKQEWEDECVKRMAKGEEAITFDDWEKDRKEKLEKERKDAERKRKEEEKRLKEERRKAREAAKRDNDDDDDELESFTEKELAEMRGYKKTKDGRITSYFTREQSHQIDIAPKPICTTPQPITPSSSAGETNGESETGGRGKSSVWNHAGTWEEKDTTEWCRDQLKKRLKETKVEAAGGHMGLVTEVKDMTGDASVAIVSGKKRYIFDFHCKLKFKLKEADTDDVLASGTLRLPDICSTHHEELEVEFEGWKKKPSSDNEAMANDTRQMLESEVRESVKLWVADFNSHY